MSKRTSYIFILSFVAVTILGIVVGAWLFVGQEKYVNEKTIALGEERQDEMDVKLSGLCPGMSRLYEINLRANSGDGFKITMAFERAEADSLAQFVDVEVRACGETVDSAKLSEYLDGKQISFPVKFDGVSEINVEIVYSMGRDVGDEAQNAEADFKIVISSER